MYEKIDKMKYSPMMRQYLTIKEQYPDMIIFFRLGDFYEMFFNDAIIASKELEIVLTGKDAGTEERVPMCGVPYHSVSSYLDILTSKGYKVGIVEQVEDPKSAKGIVKRELVRIITPGTVIDPTSLDASENNYLLSISQDKERYILSYIDLSTGEGFLTNIPLEDTLLHGEVLKLKAREVVVNSSFNKQIFSKLENIISLTISIEDNENLSSYFKNLLINLDEEERKNYSRLLNYITRTQMRQLVHLQKVVKYDINSYLKIDLSSRRNLELLETLRFQNKKNTLLSVLDKCVTAMGSRYLKKTIMFPFIEEDKIVRRYNIIEKMKKSFLDTNDLREYLSEIYDLERIVGRIAYENANPKDLLQLKKSLSFIPKIRQCINKIDISQFFDLYTDFNKYKELYSLIDSSISSDAPFAVKDGGVIKDGFNKELDELREINLHGKDYIINLEAKERDRTGIKQLKVGFNKVFGYYIEVSKSNIPLIKDEYGYIRKQTLANAERYITQELKEKETLILRAEEKTLELETKLFNEIRNKCKDYTNILQTLAKVLSELDMMQSFTKVSNENKYVRPNLNNDHILKIKEGRHPVLDLYEDFIPNDIEMTEDRVLLITGPNMSGKSTYMRQIALISILAQMGCFVPAKSANLPIFDQIFTRIGAADDIVSGQSTFMVEMIEVNNALENATENSLILFDEIGRGTATFDGMALAQSIIEYVHNEIKCKTLFSTHYHELTALEQDLKYLKNVHVSAEEIKGEIIFLHKVKLGAVDKSYGINVAKLANLPLDVVLRASDLLNKLQNNNDFDHKKLSPYNYVAPLVYDSKTEIEIDILNELKSLNFYEMSPIDALNKLNEIQGKLKK
ncbi:MAG TPA: DNA mismatch repair protein MutS [Acholeplasmataceae bacterium]|nr:DNA mismatch repair protein MutS [Acholeplasmataceae bacterium]